ncbi:O-acetylhomoserine aminocarboxypropyltransferase/cysteine synthase family protein [Leucothrix mucor]|uniref:O-acetylhomoserine aminocarboxypropyltransferase/cysteine synthase family protein n=1 Tax=Leucothrix mucor TaxID=45248 RepID=UPI0003B6C1E0|nr:O-acetylhomoserine aminocarboxypropyltransferase/cysteine synthase family protein [Leucothrix mucor]
MSRSSYLQPDTIALHTGYQPESDHGSRAVPIYQTTSYVFDDVDEASSLFNVEQGGHIYSRITNPTVAVLEQRIAALEGGSGAICTASGMSALYMTFITLCSAGDHIVSSAQIYGSTATLLRHTLKRLGIDCTFVAINDQDAVAAAIQDNTKMVFCESIGNPGLEVADLDAICGTAHAHGLPVVIDATFATPSLCRPIEHGVNVVVHSATKWMGGHGVAVGGVVVDGGNFDWKKSGRFPELTEPYAPFHGIKFWEEFGPSALAMRMRAESMRDLGAAMSPHSAFLLLQGIETLNLRMRQHVENAHELMNWLVEQDAVSWVNHPDLATNPTNDVAKRLFPKGAGSMLCFGVKGGRPAGAAFINALQLGSNLANVGDSRTLVLHPGSTTHSRLSTEQMEAAGISEDMIRVSVGIEDIKDIKADFAGALRAAQRVAEAG